MDGLAAKGTYGTMRVLTLTPFYPTESDDAAGCFIAEPLRALENFEIQSSVVPVRPFYRGRLRAAVDAPRANWTRYCCLPGGIGLSSAGAFLFARLIAKVRRLHRAQPIDLIHAHAALPCGHAAALLNRQLQIPFVVTVHGLDAYFTHQVRGRTGEFCQRISQSVYRAAARVICISDKVRSQVLNGALGHLNAEVVYNSADPAMFMPGLDSSTRPVILSVGNLIPIKAHELLLRAVAAVRQEFPDACCEIIGEGPERDRLNGLSRELNIADKVRFLGRQSRMQVAEAMRRCTLFVLPSRYEGLGCVYLEAMSAAKPVIACRDQGIAEIIRHRSNGWLIAPGNVAELSDAISQLLQDAQLRREIGSAARQTILDGLTLNHQAARLAALYRECVA